MSPADTKTYVVVGRKRDVVLRPKSFHELQRAGLQMVAKRPKLFQRPPAPFGHGQWIFQSASFEILFLFSARFQNQNVFHPGDARQWR